MSHALTDQTSILRFIEDNWLSGERISEISFDRIAGSLDDMFDFSASRHAPGAARSRDRPASFPAKTPSRRSKRSSAG